MSRLHSIIGATCVLSLSSCATSLVRSDANSSSTELYPATKFNAFSFVETSIKGEPIFPYEEPGYKEPTSMRVLTGVSSLIDLPFSLVTDTLLLPLDLKRRADSGD